MNQHRRQQKRENTFLEQSIFALHMLALGKLGYMFQKMSPISVIPVVPVRCLAEPVLRDPREQT